MRSRSPGSSLAVPRRFWLYAIVLLLTIPNVIVFNFALNALRSPEGIYDWELFQEATARIGTGTLYHWGPMPSGTEYSYRYSPVLAYAMAPVVALGLEVWRLLHVAALLLLPKWLAAATLVAAPFWFDVAHANVISFVFVFGYLTLRGSRWAALAYVVLALLVPRPLMLPLLVWIVWKHPEWRMQIGAILLAYALLTLATGEAFSFMASLAHGTDIIAFNFNWGPSRFIGLWWLVIGVPLAAWLTWRGRIGFAAVAISPYWLGYYLLVLLWELVPNQRPERGHGSPDVHPDRDLAVSAAE